MNEAAGGGARREGLGASTEDGLALPLNPDHTPYHPKWHRERVPITWWTRNRRYMAFIARELTSVLVLYAGVLLLVHLVAVNGGADSHQRFLEWASHPGVLAWHLFLLAGLLFHAFTWLSLAPRALVVRVGRIRVSPAAVLLGHYAAWVVVSAAIATLLVWTLGVGGDP